MVESVFFKPVSLGLAIVTLIESLIWAVFSFLCVLCYNDIIGFDENDKSMSFGLNKFTNSLYDLYLSAKPSIPNANRVVIPDTFHILMWIYFILSLLLFFSSGVHISVLCKNSKPRKTNLSTIIWQTFIYIVCLFDIITCILFSLDYHYIRDYIKTDTAETELKLAVTITLLVLAAKGFILWIFNFTLAVIVSVIFKSKVENEPILQVVNPKIYARTNAAYDAYGDVTLDPQIDSNSVETKEADDDQPQLNNWLPDTNSESERDSMSSSPTSFRYRNNNAIIAPNNFARVPRARTDSYQVPRSLMSSNPSPVPAPSLPSTHLYHEPIINNDNNNKNDNQRRQSIYEKEDDDDDENILNSPEYLSSAFPHPSRFTLHEPIPDY